MGEKALGGMLINSVTCGRGGWYIDIENLTCHRAKNTLVMVWNQREKLEWRGVGTFRLKKKRWHVIKVLHPCNKTTCKHSYCLIHSKGNNQLQSAPKTKFLFVAFLSTEEKGVKLKLIPLRQVYAIIWPPLEFQMKDTNGRRRSILSLSWFSAVSIVLMLLNLRAEFGNEIKVCIPSSCEFYPGLYTAHLLFKTDSIFATATRRTRNRNVIRQLEKAHKQYPWEIANIKIAA